MALTGNKVYDVFINSTNRSPLENSYDFNLFFDNNEIVIGENEGININVVSFSMLNSMYNVNQYSSNNTFILISSLGNSTITIPYGNYNVYTFLNQLNSLLTGYINVSYNLATNSYTYTNINPPYSYSIIPLNCSKFLGLSQITSMSVLGTTSSYVNIVNYQQIILRCQQ